MNQLSSSLIQQDVREVSISQTDDVSDHGGCRDASSVVEPHGEPRHRILVSFGEVVSEDGLELLLEGGEFVLQRVGTRAIGSFRERSHRGGEVVAADVLRSIPRCKITKIEKRDQLPIGIFLEETKEKKDDRTRRLTSDEPSQARSREE